MAVLLLLTIPYINYYYYYYYYMAKSISAPFTVAQTLDLSSTTAAVTDSVDLSAYVDPADRQGIEVLAVDFIFHNGSTLLPISSASDFQAAVQVKDNSAGDLIDYDNLHLTASAGFVNDGNAVVVGSRREDLHGADLDQLLGHACLAHCALIHIDADEHR